MIINQAISHHHSHLHHHRCTCSHVAIHVSIGGYPNSPIYQPHLARFCHLWLQLEIDNGSSAWVHVCKKLCLWDTPVVKTSDMCCYLQRSRASARSKIEWSKSDLKNSDDKIIIFYVCWKFIWSKYKADFMLLSSTDGEKPEQHE